VLRSSHRRKGIGIILVAALLATTWVSARRAAADPLPWRDKKHSVWHGYRRGQLPLLLWRADEVSKEGLLPNLQKGRLWRRACPFFHDERRRRCGSDCSCR